MVNHLLKVLLIGLLVARLNPLGCAMDSESLVGLEKC